MIFIINRYYYLYFRIVENAKTRKLLSTQYKEKHHILPKSLGGSDEAENLVELTYKEHRICHKLLVKFTIGKDRSKMAYSLLFFKVNDTTKKAIGKYISEYKSLFTVITDGEIDKRWLKGEPIPDGFRKGFSPATVKKHGDGNKSKKWITDGITSKQPKDGILPDGWYYGQAEYQKEKNSLANSGENNPMFGRIWVTNGQVNRAIKKCDDIPLGWYLGKKEKLSAKKAEAKLGNKNPMFGKVPANAIKIILNGIEYNSMKEAMEKTGMTRTTMEKLVREESLCPCNRAVGGATL